LSYYQDLTDSRRVRHARVARSERFDNRPAGYDDRRRQAGDDTCQRRQPCRIQQDARVDRQFGGAKQIGRSEGEQRVEAPLREHHAECSSGHRQQHALDQQLPDDGQATGAEGRTDGNFLLSRGRSRDQQVRDVEACDGQQDADREVENQQGGLNIAGEHLTQWHQDDGRVSVEVVHRGESLAEAIHVGASRLEARSCLQPPDDADDAAPAVAPRAIAIQPRRRPDIGVVVHEAEGGRHHADDLRRDVIQMDEASDDAPVAAEARLPETMADDGRGRRIRPVVVFGERSAEHRLDAQQKKELMRHGLSTQPRRLAGAGERDRPRHPRGEPVEGPAFPLPVEPVRRRHAMVAPRSLVDHHDVAPLRIGQRA
jgi:hypothetical protein